MPSCFPGLRQLLSQLGYAGLIRCYARFYSPDTQKKVARFGGQWCGIFDRVAHRGREGEIHGMVAQPEGLLREGLLLVCNSERRQLLCGIEGVRIDQRGPPIRLVDRAKFFPVV